MNLASCCRRSLALVEKALEVSFTDSQKAANAVGPQGPGGDPSADGLRGDAEGVGDLIARKELHLSDLRECMDGW